MGFGVVGGRMNKKDMVERCIWYTVQTRMVDWIEEEVYTDKNHDVVIASRNYLLPEVDDFETEMQVVYEKHEERNEAL
jgi:hypothetical protein